MDPWQMAYPSFASLYNPGTYGGIYGAPGGGNAYQDTPWGQQYLEDNQRAAFGRWLTNQGYGGLDNRSNVANNLYGRIQQGYEQALGDNPFMGFATGQGNYLSTVNFANLMRSLTPQQRGENPAQFNQKSQWLVR